MVNRQVAIQYASELKAIEENIIAGVSPVVNSYLQTYHGVEDFLEQENDWRAENDDRRRDRINADEQTGEIEWDYTALLSTMVDSRHAHFTEYMRHERKRAIRNRQGFWLDVKHLINYRDKASHQNLGPFTEADYDEFVSTGTRVLRILGSAEAAKQIEGMKRSALPSKAAKEQLSVAQTITHKVLSSVFDDGLRIGPMLNERNLREAFDVDSVAYGGPATMSLDLFIEWQKAFNQAFICAWRDGRPFAGIGLIPVDVEWAEQFRNYHAQEVDLTAAVISKSRYDIWYFSGLSGNFFSVDDPVSVQRQKFVDILGQCILEWACRNVARINEKTFTILAEGTTSLGTLLMEKFEFSPCQNVVPDGKRPRYWKEMTLADIKYALATDPFFDHARTLHARVISAPALRHL